MVQYSFFVILPFFVKSVFSSDFFRYFHLLLFFELHFYEFVLASLEFVELGVLEQRLPHLHPLQIQHLVGVADVLPLGVCVDDGEEAEVELLHSSLSVEGFDGHLAAARTG